MLLSFHSHLFSRYSTSLGTVAFLLLLPFSFVVGERTYTDRITIGPEIGQDLFDLLLDDFTGDGNPDLIATTGNRTQISFVENEGQGLFGLPVSVASNDRFGDVRAVASGDFNNDGLTDFVVAISLGANTDSAVRIYWNDAQNPGTFHEFSDVIPATTLTLASVQGRDVQVFDMNGDGVPDILLTVVDDILGNFVNHGMLLLLENDGTGHFEVRVLSEELQGHGSIAIGDYNADGLPDVAVNARYRNAIFSWTNNGNGTYEKKVVDSSASSNWAMSSGDVNDDGYDDLLCQGENTTTLYVNNRNGTFQELYQYEVDGRLVPGFNRKTMIHDVDGDGLMDLVTMPGKIYWQKQTSSNPLEFSAKLNLLADTGSDEITPAGFTFEDVNGDGILDLVASQYTSPNSVYAYLGKDSLDNVIQFSFIAILSNGTTYSDVEIAFENSTQFFLQHPNIYSTPSTPDKTRKLGEEPASTAAAARLLEPAGQEEKESYTIDVNVTKAPCNAATDECVLVVVTVSTSDNIDFMRELVESAVQAGSYFYKLWQYGLDSFVVRIPDWESPILRMPTAETTQPTGSPTEPPTVSSNISGSCNTDAVSGAVPRYTTWNTIVSGVFSALLLCLA